jgi:ABC-2 type transport system ATP-binding protein
VTAASAGRVAGRPARTGYVPERFPGRLPFSGREYLLHMARVHGLRGAACGRVVDEWLDRLGATGYADQPLGSLSKGMCQKIAITQALLPRPGLLVLDEAWTGLDQAARGALDAAAVERAAAGGTVLFVDHDPARLAGSADERWRLESGGRFTALPGDNTPAGAGRPAPGDGGGAAHDTRGRDTAVTIELAGLEDGSLTRLAGLPGVLSCTGASAGTGAADPATADPAAAHPAAAHPAAAWRAVVRVASGHSDDVLREALSWDGVRVVSVGRGGAR